MNDLRIVLFWFNDDWGQFGRTYERVAKHLAQLEEVSKVLCFFPPPQRTKKDGARSIWLRPINPKLALVTEPWYSETPSKGVLGKLRFKIDRIFLDKSLKKFLRKSGCKKDNTLLWVFPPHPYIERMLQIIPNRGVITEVLDDFTKFDTKHELYGYAKLQYPKIGNWSDVIITTSEANRETFSKTGKPCHLFHPAVEDFFIADPEKLPFRTNGEPPHLGYLGWIMDRTDLNLIGYVARTRPDWLITLVGPQYPTDIIDQSNILQYSNVKYLGKLPQDQVPAYLRTLDVCLIPHKDNEYSRSMGPLKLYQYLASGRPIVSTDIAGLENIREHVRVATDYANFVTQIDAALKFDTTELAASRIQAARKETWSIRVREVFSFIKQHLPC